MRVLVLAGVWPYVRENTEAANVVAHEIISHLLGTSGCEVAFARVSNESNAPTLAARSALGQLEARGLTVFPTIQIAAPRARSRARRLVAQHVSAKPEVLLRGAANAREVAALCRDWNATCALTVWSETATASLFGAPVPKMAYYGNVDYLAVQARVNFQWKHRQVSWDPALVIATLKGRVGALAVKRAHLEVMRSFDAVGDVAANDAALYQREGVRAFYIRNMWPGDVPPDWESIRDHSEQSVPLKIVGNVGNLSATGNTHGLYTFATSVLPALKRTLGEGNFEVHLYGAREPHPLVKPLLHDPHIRIRGFVDDLDAEILSAPVFLVSNNHDEYKVGHTRFLHAWSLGSCVVAFNDSAGAMPEIVHRKNALLADSPEALAGLVAEAAANVALRRSLGRAGVRTLRDDFDPATVTKVIAERLVAISRDAGGV
jgi:hypothetical protein